MKKLFLFIILVLTAFSASHAQKILRVSTIPNQADIYVGTTTPDHADKPDYKSTAFIDASEQGANGEILLHIFRQEFNDTTIKVTLSQKDTSYLVVSLRPTYDSALLEEQERILGKRSRRSFGHKLMFASIVPFVISGAASLVTLYQINQANDAKRDIEKTLIVNSDEYQKSLDNFDESRNKAKTAKYTTFTSLAIGAVFLSVGFVLSF